MSAVADDESADGVSSLLAVTDFDLMRSGAATDVLRPCCASTRWLREVVLGRPYGSLRALQQAGADVIASLAWSDLAEALAAHPRIGDRVTGADREAQFSRSEQSGAAGAEVAAALLAGNRAYEARFGHVFLICATGRSAEQMLVALHERLGNQVADEREVVRAELAAIVALRLIKTFR